MRAVFWRGSHRRQRCDSLLSLRTFLDGRLGAVHFSLLRSEPRQGAGRCCWEEECREPARREASWRQTSAAPTSAEVRGHTTENMAASIKVTVVLKAVKNITVQFCPFESNVRSTRMFLSVMSSHKVRATNLNCEVISTVKHDRSEPVVEITYLDGDKLMLKGAKLNSSEMLSAFQSMCAAKELQAKLAAAKK
ncbi:hypothetical protein NQZ68_001891 [Dissostichus eleginoides]|nr:hypothetical protein NQZ68_001891 [Dissostichus eleginoides]